jgi:toluene monooxygenase system ferredoxin subunit
MVNENINSWHKVCHLSEIEETVIKRYTIKNIDILFVKVNSEYMAFPSMCPHMAEPLDESGLLSDGSLTCSKHLWQWDLKTGTSQGAAEINLLKYDTKLDEEYIWVLINEELKYSYQEEDDDDDFEW